MKFNELIFSFIYYDFDVMSSSLVAQMVKHLPAVWETWVQSLAQVRSMSWEDPLEKEMSTHSSTLV